MGRLCRVTGNVPLFHRLIEHSSRIHNSHAIVAFQIAEVRCLFAPPIRRVTFVVSNVFPVLLACIAIPAIAGAQTTVTLDAPGTEVTDDATIRGEDTRSVNFGTSDTLRGQDFERARAPPRALLKFDTQNHVPAGAVINSAQLYVTLKSARRQHLRPIGVYRVTKSFLAREATWLDYRDAAAWGAGRRKTWEAVPRRRTSETQSDPRTSSI